MKKYRIKLWQSAYNDLADIVDYLSGFSEETAMKHYDSIIKEITKLKTTPEICPPAKDDRLRRASYRFLVVKYYLVFFKIAGNIVQIHRIFDGRSQYEKQYRSLE
jgi:plasmid stabilization system protein ParE